MLYSIHILEFNLLYKHYKILFTGEIKKYIYNYFKNFNILVIFMEKISVVIPAYNASKTIQQLIRKLENTLNTSMVNFEIIIIDDSSLDNTWKILQQEKLKYSFLKIVRLLKNYGQHNAILCGFNLVTGSIVITMDADLQHRPEDIPALITSIKSGYDLAIGAYDTKKHSRFRNFSGNLIDYVIRKIFDLPSNFKLTSFRAIRISVVTNVIAMNGVYPYITTMLFSHAARYINVPVKHEYRKEGKTTYTLKRSLYLALNLLLNYSSYPLYFIIILCGATLAFSGVFSLWVIYKAVLIGNSIPGWASTMLVISCFNSLILMALVIHGLYLSRLNQQITGSKTSFTIGEIHE